MGTWGPGIFQDDAALDAQDEFRELVGAGVSVAEATGRVRERDPEPMTLVALALTQWKTGRLLPEVRDEALGVLDAGGDLERWDDDRLRARRARELKRVRALLVSPQRAPTAIAPLVLNSSPFAVGDLVAYTAESGRTVAFRVIKHDIYQRHMGEDVNPVLQLAALGRPELPSIEAMLRGIPERVPAWKRSFQQYWVSDGANATGERWAVLVNAAWSEAPFTAIGADVGGRKSMYAKKPRGKHKQKSWIETLVDRWYEDVQRPRGCSEDDRGDPGAPRGSRVGSPGGRTGCLGL